MFVCKDSDFCNWHCSMSLIASKHKQATTSSKTTDLSWNKFLLISKHSLKFPRNHAQTSSHRPYATQKNSYLCETVDNKKTFGRFLFDNLWDQGNKKLKKFSQCAFCAADTFLLRCVASHSGEFFSFFMVIIFLMLDKNEITIFPRRRVCFMPPRLLVWARFFASLSVETFVTSLHRLWTVRFVFEKHFLVQCIECCTGMHWGKSYARVLESFSKGKSKRLLWIQDVSHQVA